ncbi:MAG: GNAT family N-acetyltransferase [Theionarchaea archaeon]|nr:GNAT family N-acetyltransferase [Theionarchaea archaeon]MBU7001012.1 GNAT family N-acetyltransferase [Theionarchaea archaeon]MBU7020501.1 GNAT family N-acetyltransferase [Theionarchaea archaeon]MBU7034456.1 GNAT family N-acetyltransferase [Theionarchaea archaeon]MBU7039795.1 GNAT family N-acetyltransferase [Theionarchaea archaeon]
MNEEPEVSIHTTVRDFTEEEWNRVADSMFPECCHGWYRAVEDSCMRDMYYVALRQKNALTAVLGCCPFVEKQFGISIPFLEVGSPLGTASSFFLESPEHVALLLGGVEQILELEKIKGILIFDLKQEEADLIKGHLRGFSPYHEPDRTYIDLGFSDFEDYLESLDSSNRRSIRKTLNRAEKRWKIRHILTSELSKWGATAHRLQAYLCQEHRDFRMHLSVPFYEALEKNMEKSAELTVFLKDDIPLATGLVLNSQEAAVHKFPGVDPGYRQYQAYFLLYYEGIRTAIERKQKRIYFGTTTYGFKEKIGCGKEPLLGFVKFMNPVATGLLGHFLTWRSSRLNR